MHHIMFDIDGTLLKSFEFDEECYIDAVQQILGQKIDSDWSKYEHVTDSGILDQHLRVNNLLHKRDEIQSDVKAAFIANIQKHISKHQVQAIAGAIEFVEKIKLMPSVSLSIATGGWRETAIMKLNSAGFDMAGIPLSSSSDHYSRIEIMKNALVKSHLSTHQKVTYFGDAEWDKKACESLNINFVLIGSRVEHKQSIPDFTFYDEACNFIGL